MGNAQTFQIDSYESRTFTKITDTNCESTEDFYLKDDAISDGIGKYTTTGTWAFSTDKYACSSAGNFVLNQGNLSEQTTSFSIAIPDGDTNYFYFEGYRLKAVQGTSSCDITLETSAGVQVGTTTWTKTVAATTAFPIEVITTTTTAEIKDGIGGTSEISETITPDPTYIYWVGTNGTSIDSISIVATKIYNTPMLRGCAPGIYYNGTSNVTCTRFSDDCEVDNSGNWTDLSSSSYDTTNKRLTLADTDQMYITNLSTGAGYYEFKILRSAASGSMDIHFADNSLNINYDGALAFNGEAAESYSIDTPSSIVTVGLLVGASSIAVYSNGVLKGTKTGLTIGYDTVGLSMDTSNWYIYNISLNAVNQNAPNGIAYCISSLALGGLDPNVSGEVQHITTTYTNTNVALSDVVAHSRNISLNASESAALRVTAKNNTDDSIIDQTFAAKYWDISMTGAYINTVKPLATEYNDMNDSIILMHTTDSGYPISAIYTIVQKFSVLNVMNEGDL